MSEVIFLTGTSAVGKTEFLEERARTTNNLCCNLTAREVRALLGNPPWTRMMEDADYMLAVQTATLMFFERYILTVLTNEHQFNTPQKRSIMFDRSLSDVLAYTYAYICTYTHTNTIDRVEAHIGLKKTGAICTGSE